MLVQGGTGPGGQHARGSWRARGKDGQGGRRWARSFVNQILEVEKGWVGAARPRDVLPYSWHPLPPVSRPRRWLCTRAREFFNALP